jgi:hypothetical protein
MNMRAQRLLGSIEIMLCHHDMHERALPAREALWGVQEWRERRPQPLHFRYQRERIFECGANHQVVVDLWPGPTAMYRVKRSLRTGPDSGKFFGRHVSILAGSAS